MHTGLEENTHTYNSGDLNGCFEEIFNCRHIENIKQEINGIISFHGGRKLQLRSSFCSNLKLFKVIFC